MPLTSKLPDVGVTIFTRMSQLAASCKAVNLSQGFPDFPCDPALLQGVTEAMQAGHNQYAPMTGLPALREAIASKLQQSLNVHVDAEREITVTAGATQALFSVIASVLHAGDEALILEPAYDSYAPAILAQGAGVIRVALRAPAFAVDWDEVERAVTPRTRLIIVNNPNNPATSVFGPADLDALAQLAERHDLLVLADEVYEHLVFDGRQHHSVLAHPVLRARSFAVYSFGKTFHATGWKVGYCVAPPALSAELRKLHQYLVFSVSTPMQHALAAYLQQPAHWQGLPDFYQARRERLAPGLTQAGFQLLPNAGTYFQLADYSAIRPDLGELDFAEWLTRSYGVASIPVSAFYADGRDQHLVRFCFAKQDSTLDEAIKRLAELR
ncbi:methionine aminotransferase [Andreprevotia lacus DSM 23236]|jgi:methionine aminotransferase|uniref:Putative 8-amino-7-oxononanoate synthase n=1 Tax=Andreprevotia lacus DSM 23236 TaxID=1121001 RepID=A0A1W1XQY9_9NEIS|nr:methionine aminotransferase [Andreprevotia lacus]SMC26399.1 methionine aminotransferase [Andreprevotia lacus DSM 23236]